MIQNGRAQLDTRGTFGLNNQDAHNRQNVEGAGKGMTSPASMYPRRMGYDQTAFTSKGRHLKGDEDITIGALGLQVQVEAPILYATKFADDLESLPSPIAGQKITLTLRIENNGTVDAKKVLINTLLQPGLNFVPGSFKINGAAMPDRYVQLVPVGDLAVDETVIIEYQAIVESLLLQGKPKLKSTKIDYLYQPNHPGNPIALTASTNPIVFTP